MKTKVRNKLFPAIAMLLVSSVVLGTATFAWFTMSKEVKVNAIDVTATTPDSLEISLGKVNAGKTAVEAPDAATPKEWSNEVTYSTVYAKTGKLIPSSSLTGFNTSFWSTEKADKDGNVTATGDVFTKAAVAAQILAGAADATPADGGYVEIPVWIRTRGTTAADLTMKVDVTPKPGNAQSVALQPALRIAILNDQGTAPSVNASPSIWSKGSYEGGKVATAATTAGLVAAPSEFIKETGTGATTVVNVAAPTSTAQYGVATKFLVRVWIEGQDTTCKDVNAGGAYNISLNFTRV